MSHGDSSFRREKVAILNQWNREARFRDEKRALVAHMTATPIATSNSGGLKVPAVRRRDEEEPCSRDDVPEPLQLSSLEQEQYQEAERDSTRQKFAYKRLYMMGTCLLGVCVGGIASGLVFIFNGKSNKASSGDKEYCELNREALFDCRMEGLQVPECARPAFQLLRPNYLPTLPPHHYDLKECEPGHLALVALAVAETNHNMHDRDLYYALASLYFATAGKHWQVDTNWLEGISPCADEWYGVSCSSGQGLQVQLETNGLEGTLPTELGLLGSSLQGLNLSGNRIQGTLPLEVGLLSNLKELYVHDTLIGGQIPSELGACINLEQLDFTYTSITGTIPSHVGNLEKLANLTMTGAGLSGYLPTELGLLSNLKVLSLTRMLRISGTLPLQEWRWLTNLQELNVEAAGMDASTLQSATLSALTNLKVLRLQYTDLTGSIPTEIGLLSNSLQVLSLIFNSMSGTLPSEIGLLTDLEDVQVGHDRFTGRIPSELGLLTKATALLLTNSQLTGTIPSTLGLLKDLKSLYVDFNRLTGILPSELCSLSVIDFRYDSCLSAQSEVCIQDSCKSL